jgi:hypothetical protein
MQKTEPCRATGRLMSPQEVYAATLSRPNIPNELKHEWFLCGDIPENIWDALAQRQADIGYRISAFTTPVNSAYACFTMQVGRAQVRFLLALGNEKSEWFLKEAVHCGIHLSVARNDSDNALIKKFGVAPMHVTPVLDIAKRCRRLSGRDLLIDFALTVVEVRNIKAIPSIFDDTVVESVHVIAIFPDNGDSTVTKH